MKTPVEALAQAMANAPGFNEVAGEFQEHMQGLMDAQEKMPQIRRLTEDDFPAMPTAQPESNAPQSSLAPNEVIICIASEVGGDIDGFYLFDDAADAALTASRQHAWEFICENGDKVIHFSELTALFKHIKENDLHISSDFGTCVY